MKIAHVVCTFPPYKGGMGNSAFNFCEQLVLSGHDVTVFVPAYSAASGIENISGIKVNRLKSFFSFGNAAILPQLFWNLKNFDIIHFHYPFFGAVEFVGLIKILKRKKIKLVLHYHMDTIAPGIKGFIFYLERSFILPLFLRLADAITAGSLDYVANSQIKKYYQKNKQKFYETLFGVNRKRFFPNSQTKNRTVLFVAGLDEAHYFKGLNVLLEAIKEINDRGHDIFLDVIGSGNLLKQYEDYSMQLGIVSKVKFHGSVNDEDIVNFYQNCGVFVLPSINQGEAFGLVLLEAMSCGSAVIASNLPGVRNVFENGKQGFLVEPGDSHDLADKIIEIIETDRMIQFGQAGRKLVDEIYDWKSVGNKLENIYKKL